MANPIIVDTGPLVALLDRRDYHHDWTINRLRELTVTLRTCESVLSETSFLLRGNDPGFVRLGALVHDGIIKVDFNLREHFESVSTLLKKYATTPMSFADACLVRMSEIHPGSKLFTTDSDFLHYRRNGRNVIPLIYPDSKK
jgi:predicted nucleic acid-binding protein